MLPVEILCGHGAIVLRARNSELLILQQHVSELANRKVPKEFSEYFMRQALVNRPARKLFEAWLRKDHTLWRRLYQSVHDKTESGKENLPEDALEASPAPQHTVPAES